MLLQIAMKEGTGGINAGHWREAAMLSTMRMVAGLTIGVNFSPKSTLARWVKPRTTQRALYRSSVPSDLSLCVNTHFARYNMCTGRAINKAPSAIGLESTEFALHGSVPMWIT